MNLFKTLLNSLRQKSSSQELLLLSIISIAGMFSVYSFYFFFANKVFLIGSDAYYYMSIADSIMKFGEMRDITAIPSFPVKSPQNGIVFVHVILSLLGLSAKGRIFTIVAINYLLYLSSIYPLYKIARWSGFKKGFPLVALLAVYMGAWHIYRINLLAINDGIFNSLTLWLVYLVIKFVRDIKQLDSTYLSVPILIRIMLLSLLVMLLVQFRLNAALVIGSALIAALAIRDYKASLFFASACVLLVISFGTIYSFLEVVRLENVSENYFFPMFRVIDVGMIKLQVSKILPRVLTGLSGITNPFAKFIFMIVPLSMIYYGIRGLIEKNFSKVFISGICLTGLWFTMTFQNARVIWYTFPFIFLILLHLKSIRLMGYAFVLLVFVLSMHQFYIGFSRAPESRLWLHIYDKGISIPPNALLSSQNRRHPYFFLGTRNYLGEGNWRQILEKIKAPGKFMPELTWDIVNEHSSFFVMGDSSYVKHTYASISELAASNDHEMRMRQLTPDLDDFEGWTLVEFLVKKNDPI